MYPLAKNLGSFRAVGDVKSLEFDIYCLVSGYKPHDCACSIMFLFFLLWGVLYCYGLFMDMHSLYMYTSRYPHNSLQIPMRCNHFLRIICELCPNLFPPKKWVSYNVTPQLQVGFDIYSIYHKCWYMSFAILPEGPHLL